MSCRRRCFRSTRSKLKLLLSFDSNKSRWFNEGCGNLRLVHRKVPFRWEQKYPPLWEQLRTGEYTLVESTFEKRLYEISRGLMRGATTFGDLERRIPTKSLARGLKHLQKENLVDHQRPSPGYQWKYSLTKKGRDEFVRQVVYRLFDVLQDVCMTWPTKATQNSLASMERIFWSVDPKEISLSASLQIATKNKIGHASRP